MFKDLDDHVRACVLLPKKSGAGRFAEHERYTIARCLSVAFIARSGPGHRGQGTHCPASLSVPSLPLLTRPSEAFHRVRLSLQARY